MKPRHQIVHTPKFERNFKKLSFESQTRISEEILLLETDPAVGKRLHGELKNLFSLRLASLPRERTVVTSS